MLEHVVKNQAKLLVKYPILLFLIPSKGFYFRLLKGFATTFALSVIASAIAVGTLGLSINLVIIATISALVTALYLATNALMVEHQILKWFYATKVYNDPLLHDKQANPKAHKFVSLVAAIYYGLRVFAPRGLAFQIIFSLSVFSALFTLSMALGIAPNLIALGLGLKMWATITTYMFLLSMATALVNHGYNLITKKNCYNNDGWINNNRINHHHDFLDLNQALEYFYLPSNNRKVIMTAFSSYNAKSEFRVVERREQKNQILQPRVK